MTRNMKALASNSSMHACSYVYLVSSHTHAHFKSWIIEHNYPWTGRIVIAIQQWQPILDLGVIVVCEPNLQDAMTSPGSFHVAHDRIELQ